MQSRRKAFRRTVVAAVSWLTIMAVVAITAPAATGQEGVEPGRGSAYAQGYRIDPRSGRLSFGITYGMALAGHQNIVAVGEARSVDLGVIGTTLAAEGCDGGDPTYAREDQPQPLVVRSGEEGAAEGKSEPENGVDRFAAASDRPLARSRAITAATGDPAAAQIGSTVSETSSGIVDGVRVARAITDVSEIRLAAGQVVLKGLRWEAAWQSAPAEQVSGSFTIEGVEIAGQSMTVPENDGASNLDALNPALEPFGIRIESPKVRNESGISFVDPMRIGIVPSETRDGILGPIFNAAQPVREALVDALIGIDCSNASYITVADIALGSLTGAGSMNIELGGVTAQSADLGQTNLLRDLPTFTPAEPAGVTGGTDGGGVVPGTPGSSSSGGTDSGEGSSVVTTPAATGGNETALPAVKRIAGTRGGPLVWIGLAGLLLLGALAEMDRRKMRAAQRAVPLDGGMSDAATTGAPA